ncbi:beta-1,4-galactosyltransferase 7 isoform X2 [Eurytemora carolleeae]|uniref:beta-1,4-galactosyltransferase 7 isoform X2 n=1 Tax=Eurytemora carolleeae TaxID=1294199 RepID=UPI000C775EE7|nr:beta-1,4-galactosyltransferase 7 isoform X2 [Eurytemora carolleeae]|eukprot:XP_023347212.1 beta-1,4-galactosyltransferase 7-like isoform X2 [Eurytemora affinis]
MALKQSEVKVILCVLAISCLLLVSAILYWSAQCLVERDASARQELVSGLAKSLDQVQEETGPGSRAPHHLCILVPFRDRFQELLEFAPHMKSFLDTQKISYEVWVLNQVDGYRFNRASLINVGFKESSKSCDYIGMHDVDLLPINQRLDYTYPGDTPMHISSPGLHPKYDYETFIGGIFLISRQTFKLVDGMSNKYWGWGLEDDEFFVRLRQSNIEISRPKQIGTGKTNTFKHIHTAKERKRDNVKCYNQANLTRRRDRQTGLSTLDYHLVKKQNLVIDKADVHLLDIKLICDTDLTPWCNCTGAPPETAAKDRTRDEDVIVPLIKRKP